MTALTYSPSRPDEPFSLLNRHLARLQDAHAAFARELPDCWCASRPMPDDAATREELERAVEKAKASGKVGDLRIRLSILPPGRPLAETFPLTPMPSYPVRLVLDDRPTEYGEPFLRYKTSQREVYDEARRRQGATLHPSPEPTDPPFDVLLFNTSRQITETTISNVAFQLSGNSNDTYITPSTDCGLLEGVMRAELLEKGEIKEGVVTIDDLREAAKRGALEIICFNGVRGVFPAYIALEDLQ
ncbi:Para-aminobenzoate synthase, subunit I [Rhodotorula toruloides ATCC 204091]|uniref:Para-aminobenzoate synthase, subunit I n=1 Tax=Rhodotorula toruloides TaxID=5286 RepID=A0A0K3C9Y7_RHOTO|nr:Para-aminobenzoate synthase, subunit I [Rhodotorula toruloides ATCC 204091]PRQ77058.1 para-aminobenzoate synthase, subunit I [Rhodotorula toruloides]